VKANTVTSRPTLPIRILCVDDNADMLEMMRMLLDTEPSMQCVGCLHSADQLIEFVAAMEPPPQIILLDATMPGEDPLTVLSKMSDRSLACRTIVFSGYDDAEFLGRVRRAGAWGFVSKRDEPGAFLDAIKEVAAGRQVWP
jgi:two-component system nitrate/nitrite response regulator NarP